MPSMVEESFNTADQTRSFDCAQDDKKNSALKEQVTLNMIYYISINMIWIIELGKQTQGLENIFEHGAL